MFINVCRFYPESLNCSIRCCNDVNLKTEIILFFRGIFIISHAIRAKYLTKIGSSEFIYFKQETVHYENLIYKLFCQPDKNQIHNLYQITKGMVKPIYGTHFVKKMSKIFLAKRTKYIFVIDILLHAG